VAPTTTGENHQMKTRVRSALSGSLSLVLATLLSNSTLADDIQRHGESYVIYLPATLQYSAVVDRVQTEILAQNWDVVNVQDVGLGLRKLGVWTDNTIIQACQSQYLKQAVRKDPFISLIIPCRFTVFREHVATGPGGDYEAKPARIVVGFADPVSEAKAVGLTQIEEAEAATEELKEVLVRVADFYKP
jgi:hypothetical protein